MNTQKIIELYNNKYSTYEIAKEFNTYPNKIRRILLKNGVQLNDKSTAQKNALQKGTSVIPTVGKKRTESEKIKISKSMQQRWKSMSEKAYQERINQAKKRWQNMSEEDKSNMARLATKAIQKAGKEGSKLEKFLKIELSKKGFSIEVHKKNLIPNENLEIDMYIPSCKAIIEIDGPSHFLPIWGEEKLQKQIKADANKTGLVLSKGFVVIRIKHLSNSLSLHDRHYLKDKIADMLNGITESFPEQSKRYIELEI